MLLFAANLAAPVLFITAKGDRYGAAEATPQLYAAATKASSRRLKAVARDGHGAELLTGPNGRQGPGHDPRRLSKQARSP